MGLVGPSPKSTHNRAVLASKAIASFFKRLISCEVRLGDPAELFSLYPWWGVPSTCGCNPKAQPGFGVPALRCTWVLLDLGTERVMP